MLQAAAGRGGRWGGGGGVYSGCGRGKASQHCKRVEWGRFMAAPCRQQWLASREVAGGGAAGRGLHSTARGWGGGVSVAAPC